MHPYDRPGPAPYRPVPPPAPRPEGGSPTPIFDALCREFARRAQVLPGDRAHEESTRFAGFWPRDPSGRADYGVGPAGYRSAAPGRPVPPAVRPALPPAVPPPQPYRPRPW